MKPGLIRALVMITCIIIVLGITFLVLYEFIPDVLEIIKEGDGEMIQEYIRSNNSFRGTLIIFILFLVHFISIVIPCVQVQIAAGAVYGQIPGVFICLVCITISGIIIYLAATLLGKKLDSIVGEKKKQSKFDSLMTNTEHPCLMLMIACFIPLVPQATIPYLALKAKIPFGKFALIEFFGNIPVTFMMCLIGNLLVTSGVYASLIMTCITVVLSVIIWWQRNNIIRFFLWFYTKCIMPLIAKLKGAK